MDLHLPSSSPFTYLVGEHARAIIAIQDLQREVQSLLCFREHVLSAFPHLQVRDQTPSRPRPAPQTPGGKSLSEGPPTVADSGFSTDKASTSMGKSSSSSSGELSGGARWPATLETTEGATAVGPQSVSAEDELLTLLDAIERKGNRLRQDLEKAEEREREVVGSGSVSDPGADGDNPASPPAEKWRFPTSPDWWPHSLPGAGPRFDFLPGLEAWGEVERLRVDRMYLLGRLQRAEAEGGAAHQRLLDLHSQLVSLASEKRRLEDAFRSALKGTDPAAASSKSLRGVTVSVNNLASPKRIPVTASEDVFLPRVLKVPIKDKWGSKPPSKIPQAPKRDNNNQAGFSSPLRTVVSLNQSKGENPTTEEVNSPKNSSNQKFSAVDSSAPGNRVVIERERRTNRVDGGLSMPASFLKDARIQVKPNKQRISAILKEKDVLALQKQLLTTVMETEVLKRQIEVAGEEWESRMSEWESLKKLGEHLKAENAELLKKCAQMREKCTVDASAEARPSSRSVGVGTSDEAEKPSHSVHQGPNVKYDVVVYEEKSTSAAPTSKTAWPARSTHAHTRKTAPVEKPPRRSRPVSVGPCTAPSTSFGRDSLGRFTRVPLRASARTPPVTPRTSPAPSINQSRGALLGGPRTPSQSQDSPRVTSPGGRTATSTLTRRDSLKMAVNSNSAGSSSAKPLSGSSAVATPPHKESGSWATKRRNKSGEATKSSIGSSGRGIDHPDATPSTKGTGLDSRSFQGSGDYFDSISSPPEAGSADTDPLAPMEPLKVLKTLTPSSRLWNSSPLGFSKRVSLSRVYNSVNPVGSWRLRDPPLPNDSLETTDAPPGAAKTSPRFNKSSYKAFRRNYPSGVLRLKKHQERPTVLPHDSQSPHPIT